MALNKNIENSLLTIGLIGSLTGVVITACNIDKISEPPYILAKQEVIGLIDERNNHLLYSNYGIYISLLSLIPGAIAYFNGINKNNHKKV